MPKKTFLFVFGMVISGLVAFAQNTYYRDADGDMFGDPNITISAGSTPIGYVDVAGDCDDTNSAIHPGAAEIVGDQTDQNCDGAETCYADADNDGYRTTSTIASADCDCIDDGEAMASEPTGDCNDANAAIHPGASEIVGDETDQNCDGAETCYADADNDGYRTTATIASTDCDCADNGEARASEPTGDCNDVNAAVRPGATEIVGDEIDQNCDGSEICYADADNDGYRTTLTIASADCDCADNGEAKASEPSGDCNDANAAVHPGVSEICDGMDNDCDYAVDESGTTVFYFDADGDGYGNIYPTITACYAPVGYVSLSGDCNDSDNTIHPGAVEIPDDGIDQNCDSSTACFADADNDGYRTTSTITSADCDCLDDGEALPSDPSGDCNDSNATIHPGISEVCDGLDNDCDGTVDESANTIFYRDADGDGYGNVNQTVFACPAPAGYVNNSGDCNDANAAIHPGATEIVGDETDQNCDGTETCYADADNDGYRTTATIVSVDCDCADSGEARASEPAGDCNDGDAAIHPGVSEVCDGIDNDCDASVDELVTTLFYRDADGDGYGNVNQTASACSAPAGYVSISGDCDDANEAIRPGVAEIPGDETDQNCDGAEICYVDADNDGYRTTATIASADCDCVDDGEAMASEPTGDCNDADAAIHPGVSEVCDGIDNDCDASVDELVTTLFYRDADEDGYGNVNLTASACSAPAGYVSIFGDCNDADGSVHPGAEETCDGIDNDCDGTTHQDTENAITENACDRYTAPDGTIYTTTGIKTAIIPNAAGCDSVITIDLTINSVDIAVSQHANILTALATPASYKWLDCSNNYSPITDESNQTFTAAVSGNYAVEILQKECIDTSACYTVSVISTIENSFDDNFIVYPNPTNGLVYIDLGANLQHIEIEVKDVSGRILKKTQFKDRQFLDFELNEPAGIYFITVISENKIAMIKLVKK
jgi:hypothetical protein